jgi:hypothetical protein
LLRAYKGNLEKPWKNLWFPHNSTNIGVYQILKHGIIIYISFSRTWNWFEFAHMTGTRNTRNSRNVSVFLETFPVISYSFCRENSPLQDAARIFEIA